MPEKNSDVHVMGHNFMETKHCRVFVGQNSKNTKFKAVVEALNLHYYQAGSASRAQINDFCIAVMVKGA